MNRNLKLLVGVVAVMLLIAVLDQSQGNLALARTRPVVKTPTPVSNTGSGGAGAPDSGGSSTGTSGDSSSNDSSSNNVVATSTQGADVTGVPGNGQNAPPGSTSVGQPGNGQNVTSVATTIIVIPPTWVPPTAGPTKTPIFRFVTGGGSRGATGVPG